MDGWTRVCARDEMAPGEHRVVDADGTMIAVFNIDGHHYAIEDVCTHDGGRLTGGPREGCRLVCPRHGAAFDLRTGAVLAPPAYGPLTTFAVREANDRIEVAIPEDF